MKRRAALDLIDAGGFAVFCNCEPSVGFRMLNKFSDSECRAVKLVYLLWLFISWEAVECIQVLSFDRTSFHIF